METNEPTEEAEVEVCVCERDTRKMAYHMFCKRDRQPNAFTSINRAVRCWVVDDKCQP